MVSRQNVSKEKIDEDSGDEEWIHPDDEDAETEDDEEVKGRAYTKLFSLAKRDGEDERERKINEYVDERGMTKEDPEAKVETKHRGAYLAKYCVLLGYMVNLRHGPLHKRIIDSVDQYRSKGYDVDKSVRRALKEHKYDLEAFV